MIYLISITLLAVDLWQVGFWTASFTLAGAALKIWGDRKKTSGEANQSNAAATKALTEAEDMKNKIWIEVYKTALAHAEKLSKDLTAVEVKLDEKEREAEEYKKKMYEFEEGYREEKRVCKDLRAQVETLKRDIQEMQSRHQVNITIMEKEILRWRSIAEGKNKNEDGKHI